MLLDASLFALGMFAWTFLEYVIHGVLSHRYRTFATPLHDVHHRDPHAVFTVGAWIPTFIVWSAGCLLFGWSRPMVFVSGVLAGFIAYEAIHYRFHFSRPASDLERRLRARHLAHHFRAPEQIHGVTSPLWDRVFGTEPDADRMRELAAPMAAVVPLSGHSNARYLLRFGTRGQR